MFPNYKGKLITIMWMGVGAAILSSMFSAVLIVIAISTNKRVKKLSNRQAFPQLVSVSTVRFTSLTNILNYQTLIFKIRSFTQ